MNTISPLELQKVLEGNPGAALLDVRTPAEFAGVHVPQARNIPLDELSADGLNLAKDQPVYLLCRSGGRAAKAGEILAKGNFARPVVVAGGIEAWLGANLPVTRGRGRVISLERQVRIAAGALVLTGVLLGWRVHPGFFGLSGFVGAGLVFAGITDSCGLGLLLAKLPWNRRGTS